MAAFGAKDFLRTQERAWLRDALPLFEEKLRDLKRGHACQLTIANERPFNKSQGYVCGSGTWNRVEMLANVFRERGWHGYACDAGGDHGPHLERRGVLRRGHERTGLRSTCVAATGSPSAGDNGT